MDNLTVTARLKVFLSHSSADADLARRLALDLQSANVDVWLDQWELKVGEEIAGGIEKGVDEAEFVVVLLTRASVASDWVNREWRRKFLDETRTESISVVPVRGETCEIPDFLAQRSHADISGGSYPLGFRHLLEILRHHLNEAYIKLPESTLEEKEFPQTMIPVVTPIALEVGSDLIPIMEPDSEGTGRFLGELVPEMRDALRAELGFPFPGIRVRGNDTDMPPRSALIVIDEVPEIMFELGRDDVVVDETVEGLAELGIKGKARDDPATGRARARIAIADRAASEAAGLATWDAAEYLIHALQAVIRRMAPLFLDIDVTRRLVDTVEDKELVDKTVPMAVSWFELTDVLRHLVDEEIGIGDLGRILKALSKCEPDHRDTVMLAERARHALSGQITAKFTRDRDLLPVLVLDPEIEILISSAIQRTSVGPYLALEPQLTQDILDSIRGQLNSLDPGAACAPILTVVEVRRFIRKLVQLEFPSLSVLSRQDLEPDTQIEPVARIRLGRTSKHTRHTSRGPSA
jgi:type III secretory pathway component EscV